MIDTITWRRIWTEYDLARVSTCSQSDQSMRYPMHHDQEFDASGLNCPLPILRAKKMLNAMAAGQVLHVIATDPGSVKDFEAFAKQTGNELAESREDGGKFHYLIIKG
jgi:tRNA 2-thiouridine synthesizing protein A